MTANDFPRCATCAHWRKDDRFSGACDVLNESKNGVSTHIESEDSFASVDFVTACTFGCINHSEIKEE